MSDRTAAAWGNPLALWGLILERGNYQLVAVTGDRIVGDMVTPAAKLRAIGAA